MKTENNILIAFILNIAFSIFEFLGGLFTNSISILSDSLHDLGDAISIGISYFMEKKSKKHADNKYTYGYIRYSVLGGVITTTILLVGSILVIVGAVKRIINPVEVNYSGMIILAIIGVILNFIAAYVTREGDSINQKAVNLHMLEDVLGWIVVLIGAIIMNFTDIRIIDPIMSIGVAIFILINSLKNLKKVLDLFLEKTPEDVDIEELKEHLLNINGVDDIHHIHVWSIDGYNNYATMHIVSKSKDINKIKKEIREELEEHNICHAILETEDEVCDDKECHVHLKNIEHHHHHHH
ncbi:MAG: cation transporter [Bacilli bacterium]|nr:cation transporter [Bacilli bacterium]MBQ3298556.1 cation transporter [Bacilli bacterium]MBQ6404693.1 cation transporter [Bacilli bacterium]